MPAEQAPSRARDPVLDEARFGQYDLRALFSVLRAATTIEADGDEVLRRAGAGLRLAEFDVLAFIYAAESIRPTELAHRIAMSGNATTVHNIVARLEKRGLVTRSPHPDDARGVLVSITDEGRDAVNDTYPLIERKVINRFAAHFSPDELRTIANLLERH
jgi:DNA-binding MarR family transcriptional regulator